MKYAQLGIFLGIALMAVGCGRDLSGTYRGSESIQSNGTNQNSDVTMTIQVNGDDNITGTYQSSIGSTGSITGKVADDTMSLNINMTESNGSLMNGSYYSGGSGQNYQQQNYQQQNYTYNGMGSTTLNYTGSLIIGNEDQATGILTGTGSDGNSSYSLTRNLNLKKDAK